MTSNHPAKEPEIQVPKIQVQQEIVKNGELIQALALARYLITCGPPEQGVGEKIEHLGIGRKFYYQRAEWFVHYTGKNMHEFVDEECKKRSENRPPSEMLKWATNLLDLKVALEQGNNTDHILRLGTSEHLAKSFLDQALIRFRQIDGCSEDRITVQAEFGISGDLYRKFQAEAQLDIFLSHGKEGMGSEKHNEIELVELPFHFVCRREHPVLSAFRMASEQHILPSAFPEKSTLVLVGLNEKRYAQYALPIETLKSNYPMLRIIEAETFHKAHDLVTYGTSNSAVITVPEFLDEDRWRKLIPIPLSKFKLDDRSQTLDQIFTPVKIVLLCTKTDGARQKPLEELSNELAKGMRQLKSDEWSNFDSQLFGQTRYFYYERTHPSLDAKVKNQKGWACSRLRLQVLRNGVLVGEHFVQNDGVDPRTYSNNIFRVVGRISRNEPTGDLQLVWTGINDTNEIYAASFVIPKRTVELWKKPAEKVYDPDRNIVGSWTGRRNCKEGMPFEPASGQIVISFQHSDLEAMENSVNGFDQRNSDMLHHLNRSVELHETRFPGYRKEPTADAWEWELGNLRKTEDTTSGLRPLIDDLERVLQHLKSKAKREGQLQ